MSKRTTQQVMDEVCGVPMSVGTIIPLEQATIAAVAAPVEEARTYVHEQAVAHLDERSCTRPLRIMCRDFPQAVCGVSISWSCVLESGFLDLLPPG